MNRLICLYLICNNYAAFQVESIKKLSNTEAIEKEKALLIKKSVYLTLF